MRDLLTLCVLPLIAAGGCSRESVATNDVDIATAADAARGSVDNYAALSEETRPPRPIASKRTYTPEASPSAEPAPTADADDGASAASAMVRRYYELIGAGRYAQAWRIWDDDGRASEMSEAAFAASFAKYVDYRAEIGTPEMIDSGAEQRHVTVPVRVFGRLREGDRPFAMAGPVTLHRATDVDGATSAQRGWRISASGVRPRPGEAVQAPAP